jgi:hypothetical protein
MSDYRDSLAPKYQEIYDGHGSTADSIAPQHAELKALYRALEVAEASNDPHMRRFAEAVRMLWVMVAQAEDTSVHWMQKADEMHQSSEGAHRDEHGNVIENYHLCGCRPPPDVELLRKALTIGYESWAGDGWYASQAGYGYDDAEAILKAADEMLARLS